MPHASVKDAILQGDELVDLAHKVQLATEHALELPLRRNAVVGLLVAATTLHLAQEPARKFGMEGRRQVQGSR